MVGGQQVGTTATRCTAEAVSAPRIGGFMLGLKPITPAIPVLSTITIKLPDLLVGSPPKRLGLIVAGCSRNGEGYMKKRERGIYAEERGCRLYYTV